MGPRGRVVGVDLAESMQARALSKARAQELENIEFQQVQRPGSAWFTGRCLPCFSSTQTGSPPGILHWNAFLKDADYLTPEAELLTWLQKRVHG